jgi:ATP-dependent Clp protease ATP-binding subunit ClpC
MVGMGFSWLKKLWPNTRRLALWQPMISKSKYERLSDEVKKVMQLANQEAQSFNHEYIGTEHILLGLLADESSVAVLALQGIGLEPRRVRAHVETFIKKGPVLAAGNLPQTPRARNVIEYSLEEARNLNHNYVGAEHVLLGLLREQEGFGGSVLMNFGLTIENARNEVIRILSDKGSANSS